MGYWIDEKGWRIAIMNMDDDGLRKAIADAAIGLGASVWVVLGCVDEMYDLAKRRGILSGPIAWALKLRTVRVWTRKKGIPQRVPWWVRRVIKARLSGE